MTFKRIDEDTVCCIVTEDDMMDNGLELEDFLQNKDKIQEFLHKIVEQAEEEVGYESKKGILSMQVAMLPEHNLAITFSEKENLGIRDMIEQMKKAVSSIEGIQDTDFLSQLEEQVRSMKDILEEEDGNTESEEKGSNNSKDRAEKAEAAAESDNKEIKYRVGIFEFETLKNVIQCCQALESEQNGESSLYRMNDTYYLVVDNQNMTDAEFLKVCGNAIEFGKFSSNKTGRIAHLKEHGTSLVLQDAVNVLSRI